MHLLAIFLSTILFFSSTYAGIKKTKITSPQTLHGLSKLDGDLKYSANFTHYDFVNPEAPKKGKVTIGKVGTFESLNGWVVKGIPADKLPLTRTTLLTRSPEEAFSMYAAVAESVEIPKDRSWIIFNIRPQAKWETGDPITADDVIFSWKTWLEIGQPFMKTYYSKVEKIEKLEPLKVKVIFKPVTPPDKELPLIISMMPLISQKAYQGKDLMKLTHLPLLSNGPYRVKSVDFGRSITYERNKNFWGSNLPPYKGRYNFDEVRIDYYRNAAAMFEAFKSGKIDYTEEENPQKWVHDYNFPASKKIKKEEITHNRPIGMTAFALNTRRDLFKDIRVRKAINLAFNFDWVNKASFEGKYKRINSFFENSDFAPHGKPTAEELKVLDPYKKQLEPVIFQNSYQSPSHATPALVRKHLTEAQQLLKEAGWQLEKGKLVHQQTKKPFNVEILITDPLHEKMALSVVRSLSPLGITASVKLLEGAQYERRKVDFDYDMILHSWYAAKSPGNEILNYVSSQSADTPGSRNYPGMKDPILDAIVEKIIASHTKEELAGRVKALDRIIMSRYYVIPLGYLNKDLIAYAARLNHPRHTSDLESRLESWWVE